MPVGRSIGICGINGFTGDILMRVDFDADKASFELMGNTVTVEGTNAYLLAASIAMAMAEPNEENA